MARIAVTGHTGFIGKHLVSGLIDKGHEVLKINNFLQSQYVDRIYHLACPSTTAKINENPVEVMNAIMDVTRKAIKGCPNAMFINASSKGAAHIDIAGPQGAYNVAKRCMETYVEFACDKYKNYRIPSVYGPGMHDDMFIKRCIDGNATEPLDPDKVHYIAHIDEVVSAMIDLRDIEYEIITLGEIYESFSSGRRGLHRPTSS
jgi:nucleoside-diphosphate-sugar epimerase